MLTNVMHNCDSHDESRTLPDSVRYPTTETMAPPTSGTFLLQVSIGPGKHGKNGLDDLCWTPEGDLLVARSPGQQVWKIELDFSSLTTKRLHLLDEDDEFTSVSCCRDGTWGVVVKGDHINLYQPGSWRRKVWKPTEVSKPANLIITENEMWVSPNYPGPVYVYGRDRVLKRVINMGGNALQCITLCKGRLIGTRVWQLGHYLDIHNLKDGSVESVGGRGTKGGMFSKPIGVTSDPTGHILVCDSGNKRVSVFTPTGVFLHHLKLELGDFTEPWLIAVMARDGKPPLLALGDESVRIYELH